MKRVTLQPHILATGAVSLSLASRATLATFAVVAALLLLAILLAGPWGGPPDSRR